MNDLNLPIAAYFAAHAPTEIPEWFIPGGPREERYFAWRVHYGHQMEVSLRNAGLLKTQQQMVLTNAKLMVVTDEIADDIRTAVMQSKSLLGLT
jgi:hypothetical protein